MPGGVTKYITRTKQVSKPAPFAPGGTSPLSSTLFIAGYDARKNQSVITPARDGSGARVDYSNYSTQIAGYVSDISGNGRHMASTADGARCDFSPAGANGLPCFGQFATGTAKNLIYNFGSDFSLSNNGFILIVVGYHVLRNGTTNRTGWSVNGNTGAAAWTEFWHEYRSGGANITLGLNNNRDTVSAVASGESIATLNTQMSVHAYRHTSAERNSWINGFATTANSSGYAANQTIRNLCIGARGSAATTYNDTVNNDFRIGGLFLLRGDAYDNTQLIQVCRELKTQFGVQGL